MFAISRGGGGVFFLEYPILKKPNPVEKFTEKHCFFFLHYMYSLLFNCNELLL